MSIAIYCNRFHQGDPYRFPVEALAGLSCHENDDRLSSESGLSAIDPWFENLTMSRLEDGGCVAVTLSRPSTDEGLFEALLVLLQIEGTVVYAPDSPLVIGKAATAVHLPPEMTAAIGEPVLVATAQALGSALFGSGPSAA